MLDGLRRWAAENILRVRTKQNPVAAASVPIEAVTYGQGPEWAPPVYGEYYARSVLVYSAVRYRAESVLRPTLRVYRVGADGSQGEVEFTHPLAEVLRRVNQHWTAGDLWRATSTYLDLWGSAFWVLTKTGTNAVPSEIWPMRPDYVRVIVSPDGNLKGFVYQRNGRQIPLLPEEVVWFRHFNPMSEYAGLSPIAVLRLSADMGIDALKSNRNLFKNGMLFGNVSVSFKDPVTDQQVAQFYKLLQKRFAGPENAFRPLILGNAAEAKNLGFAPKDMEHIQTLRWSLEDTCRVFGVPKTLLHDLTNATYSNVDAEERIFWRNTMAPYLRFLQEELNEMMVPLFEGAGESLRVEFDLSSIESLQADSNAIATSDRADVQAGIKTINEVRAERGLEPVPWGDAWWAPMTVLPVTSGATPLPPAEAPAGTMALLPPPQTVMFEPDGWKKWKPPELSEDNLRRAWEYHVKRLDVHERGFKDLQHDLFVKQERDVLRRLSEAKSMFLLLKQGVGETLFDPAQWRDAYAREGKPLYIRAILEEARGQIAQYGLGISFDVAAPSIQEWLTRRIDWWAGRVNDETARLLGSELAEASANGESIKQIQERVEKVFRFSDAVRSERIARTEMQSATNNGALEAYRQSHVVEGKMWLATMDDRVRDDHALAHRQVVPLEAKFEIGGEMLEGPGDVGGSPGNIINCRCAVSPVVRKGARALPPALTKGA